MRGLDYDPDLARDVVESLERHPGVVRASVSPLTRRVLVEFAEHEVALEELIAEVSSLELPAHPDEGPPTHPLDPARRGRPRPARQGRASGSDCSLRGGWPDAKDRQPAAPSPS